MPEDKQTRIFVVEEYSKIDQKYHLVYAYTKLSFAKNHLKERQGRMHGHMRVSSYVFDRVESQECLEANDTKLPSTNE